MVGLLRGADVAAERDERLDRVRDEPRRLDRRSGTCTGPRRRVCDSDPVGQTVGLDDTAVSLVDRAQQGDGAPFVARVSHVELAVPRTR